MGVHVVVLGKIACEGEGIGVRLGAKEAVATRETMGKNSWVKQGGGVCNGR